MGPKRFGAKGKLAFSFGNVAQDEGSAMAQFAWDQGWKTADLATDTVIVYFKAVVHRVQGPVRAARRQDRLRRRRTRTRPFGGNNVGNAVTGDQRRTSPTSIVTVTAGAYGSLGPFITGLRTAGNNTPILNSWAGDGTYWVGGLTRRSRTTGS